MARRRMIDPNFWQSEDVAKLTIRQRLLFIGLFSNADDEGKLRGNPAFIRSIIFPYEDFSLGEIETDLNCIEAVGSIIQYSVEGSRYILIVNWKKFQRVDKPQPSVIPNPVKNDSENDSKNDSESDSVLKERKLKELKREEDNNNTVVVVENPFQVFEREGFGTISMYIRDEIVRMCNEYGDQWVCDAMRVAVKSGKRKLSFVDGVLKNFKADGRDAYEQEKPTEGQVIVHDFKPDPILNKAAGFDD